MPHRLRTFARLLPAALAACLLSACVLYALGPQRHLSGASLPFWLEPLHVGITREQVVALFGPPSPRDARATSSDHLQWTEVIRPRACRRYVLALIPIDREPQLTRRVDAHFQDGHLVDATVTYLDRRGRVTSVEPLLQKPSSTFSLPPNPSLQRTLPGRSPGQRR